MSQNVEIEFKNLLSKAEYDYLLTTLPYESFTIIQKNHYFDTIDFQLQRQKCALRIRKKGEQVILTLKEPHPAGALETNDYLDAHVFEQWLNNSPIKTAHVFQRLQTKNINLSDLRCFGTLKTKRTVFKVNHNKTIVLDHSFYHGKEDYELELEVEVAEKSSGKEFFLTLLKQYNIKSKKTLPKIKRFFNTL